MVRYKRILAAADGSAQSKEALKRAIHLAVQYKSSLHICHIVESKEYSRVPLFREEIKEAAEENGLAILEKGKKLAEEAGLKQVQTIIKRDPFPEKKIVKDILPLYSIDLIVTGFSGLGPIERYMLGSVSAGLVKHAGCDVLVVKNKETEESNYRHILIAVDESSMAVNAFSTSLDLAKKHEADLTAVHVLHPPLMHSLEQFQENIQDVYMKNGELLLEKYKQLAVENEADDMMFTLDYGSPKHIIPKESAQRYQADLIIAGALGAGQEKGIRLGSVSEGIVRRAGCDVLVVRPKFLMPLKN